LQVLCHTARPSRTVMATLRVVQKPCQRGSLGKRGREKNLCGLKKKMGGADVAGRDGGREAPCGLVQRHLPGWGRLRRDWGKNVQGGGGEDLTAVRFYPESDGRIAQLRGI